MANQLAEWLDGRASRMYGGGRNQQAITELGLWKMALDAELRKIRLTVPQASCIADVLEGTLLTISVAGSLPLVYAECSSAFDSARDSRIVPTARFARPSGTVLALPPSGRLPGWPGH